ncbi:uncharacterized protein [Anabrus simplex]|uniref:uncharacterized protein n=1 Tax=Anabrus simplex TaxID=316456 RepID=UPI0035A27119
MTNSLKLVFLLLTTTEFLLIAARPSGMEHPSKGPSEDGPCRVLSGRCFSKLKDEEIMNIPAPYTRPLTAVEIDKLFADQHGRDEVIKTLPDQPQVRQHGEIDHFSEEGPNADNGVIEHSSEQFLDIDDGVIEHFLKQHPQTENNLKEHFPREHPDSENDVSEQSEYINFTEQHPQNDGILHRTTSQQ